MAEEEKKKRGNFSESENQYTLLKRNILLLGVLLVVVALGGIVVSFVLAKQTTKLARRIDTLEAQSESDKVPKNETNESNDDVIGDDDATLDENNETFLSLLFPTDGKLYEVKSKDIKFYSDVDCTKEIKEVKLISKKSLLLGQNKYKQMPYAYRLVDGKICYSYSVLSDLFCSDDFVEVKR